MKPKQAAMLIVFILIIMDFSLWYIFKSPVTLFACGFCSGVLVSMILKD